MRNPDADEGSVRSQAARRFAVRVLQFRQLLDFQRNRDITHHRFVEWGTLLIANQLLLQSHPKAMCLGRV